MQDPKPNKRRNQHRAKLAAGVAGVIHVVAKGWKEEPARCGGWFDPTRPAPISKRPKSGRATPKCNLRKRAAAKKHKSRRGDRI